MQKVRIPDGVLEYRSVGSGEPVVFIHGALIADLFRPLLDRPSLSQHYRLILYHRRGYAGSSDVNGEISVEQHANDCRALLAGLGIDRAHLVGHSYGGSVALQIARDAPDVVGSLTLLEPAYFSKTQGDEYRESLLVAQSRFRELGAEPVVDGFLKQRFIGDYRGRLERLVPGGFQQAVSDAGTFFEHELLPLLRWQMAPADLARIVAPTLLVLGERSTKWPRLSETHAELLEALPQAEGTILAGSMHIQQVDNPADLAARLSEFLSRNPLDRASSKSQ